MHFSPLCFGTRREKSLDFIKGKTTKCYKYLLRFIHFYLHEGNDHLLNAALPQSAVRILHFHSVCIAEHLLRARHYIR